MRRDHRAVRSPQAALLGGGLVLVLVAALVLPAGPLARALDTGTPEVAISAASASLVFACDTGSVPMTVEALLEPGEVVDGGTVTVTWALGTPAADELGLGDRIAVSFPVPAEVSTVPAVDVVASGVDGTAWSTGGGRLTVDLSLVEESTSVGATVMASMDLSPGLAPTVVSFGAPEELVVGGAAVGGDQRCAPEVPVPSLVRVAVVPATPPTTDTTTPTTSTTTPTTPTTRPWSAVTSTTRPSDPAAGGDAPSPPPLDPVDIPALPPPPDPMAASQVVTGGVGGAAARLDRASVDLTASTRELEAMEQQAAALERRERHLAAERRRLAAKVDHHRDEAERLAAAAYVAAVDAYVSLAATSDDVIVLGTALEQGTSTYLRLLARQADVDAQLRSVAARRSDGWESLDRAEARTRTLRSRVADGEQLLTAFDLGADVAVTGFRFPVGGPTDFSDTWHAPRSGGRLHQGTDLFAAEGTPLRSVERGVLARVGHDTLGGTKLWLVGESGTQYYYAHLSGFAPGVTDGLVVDAGAVIGYVGHTGNARTTPPHLHFEVHPGGGPAIDAYPMLRAAGSTVRDPVEDPSSDGTAPSASSTTTTTATTAATSSTASSTVTPGPTGPASARPEVAAGWGDAGQLVEGLARPTAVASAPDGTVLVADPGADLIVVLDADGSIIRSWGGAGSTDGRLHEPRGLAVGPDGTVYVADTGNARIQRFTGEGELLASWDGADTPEGPMARPVAVAVDGDQVYVLDSLNSEVRVFDPDGEPVRTWGGFGDDPGRFADPVGIAVGPDGDLYVADRFNGRVQRLTPQGEPVAQWSEGLRRPAAVAVTAEGLLIVADRAEGSVLQYDAGGHLRASWGRAQLERPEALVVDQTGRLLVADSGSGRLLAFRWNVGSRDRDPASR
ncbi:MAG: peptidoglycan DD-metalloendopeptidase family protein [Acidimicrobiales bacterium]|nr:peptidoglycan DD-metalloendopeptidase family protein [Acidimicrobiales bacterium]